MADIVYSRIANVLKALDGDRFIVIQRAHACEPDYDPNIRRSDSSAGFLLIQVTSNDKNSKRAFFGFCCRRAERVRVWIGIGALNVATIEALRVWDGLTKLTFGQDLLPKPHPTRHTSWLDRNAAYAQRAGEIQRGASRPLCRSR